jgi:glycosyltransferase involved in cell wall biosynthesis
MNAKVSVVLPIRYVHWDWLKRSISSVLEQDYPNLELIVVNDEATENIDDLIRSFGIRKYVKNDRNRKLPYSLNRGFEVADGEYHSWTSADNYMFPGMITRLVEELEHQNVSIVCGRSIVTDENDVLHDLSGSDIRTATIASCDLNAPRIEPRFTYYSSLGACFLYRKEVWEDLRGYDEARHGSEDFDFWLRASHKFTIGRIPWSVAPLYAYRTHSNSMSSTVPYCFSKARVSVLKREVRRHPENPDLKKALDYHRSQVPKEKMGKVVWSYVEPIYVRSVQQVPAPLKRGIRSLLRSSRRLFSESTR